MKSRSLKSIQPKKPPMKPHVPPRIKSPIKTGPPGGPHTPGEKEKRRKKGY